jgi:uncharacterized repeat protein (TIGR03803 family)
MYCNFLSRRLRASLLVCAVTATVMVFGGVGRAGTEKVIYSFTSKKDGHSPNAGLTLDSAGNIYGSTDFGGLTFQGNIYKLAPHAGETFTYSVAYSVGSGGGTGLNETTLLSDGAGNLYGVAQAEGPYGFGTVFELVPNADGSWSRKPIYAFKGGADGAIPVGGLVFDAAGNLYGATLEGGSTVACNGDGCGTVFELSLSAGKWHKQELYRFKGGIDGANPESGVVIDAAGNLYGTTFLQGLNPPKGCAGGCGTIFKLSPSAVFGQPWAETVLHHFTGRDGGNPVSTLLLDSAGNIYATATNGGSGILTCSEAFGCGTVVELSPSVAGWTFQVLHAFAGGSDAQTPSTPLLIDASGNLFGAAYSGGSRGWGQIFELSPGTTGWSKTEVYGFTGLEDGADPTAGLARDGSGRIYGVTYLGGQFGEGTVFQVTP